GRPDHARGRRAVDGRGVAISVAEAGGWADGPAAALRGACHVAAARVAGGQALGSAAIDRPTVVGPWRIANRYETTRREAIEIGGVRLRLLVLDGGLDSGRDVGRVIVGRCGRRIRGPRIRGGRFPPRRPPTDAVA